MLSPEFSAELDALFDAFCEDMDAKQEAYMSEHGRYWQGLSTHDEAPSKEEEAAPVEEKKASDVQETWADMEVALPATMPCSFSVNVYQTPGGEWGYTCDAVAMEGDVKYHKCKNHGEEKQREHDWQEIEEPE